MYDAIIVGVRCAGSPTAMLLARKGYRVLLIDKATFPSDTMSAHFIRTPGVAQLKRWGVLNKIITSKCPPIPTMTIDLGPFALHGMSPSVEKVATAYAPRRSILDKILVDAAVEAGVGVREGFFVEEILRIAAYFAGDSKVDYRLLRVALVSYNQEDDEKGFWSEY